MKRTTRKHAKPTRVRRPTILTVFPAYRKKAYAVAASAAQDQAVAQLAKAYRNSGLVLYVGAGVSISVGLPDWSELVQALTVRSMSTRFNSVIDNVPDMPDEDRWKLYEAFLKLLRSTPSSERPILMLARALKGEMSAKLGAEIARVLYRRLRGGFPDTMHRRQLWQKARKSSISKWKDKDEPALALLDAIAKLARFERDAKGVQAIINYNYDDLLEVYLQYQNIKCKAVLNGKDQVPDGTLPSYHVHGLIKYGTYKEYLEGRHLKNKKPASPGAAEGNFVFSEDEYHAEYADAYRWSNLTQMNHLGRHTGLLIGLSMEDPNIRRLVDVTHQQYPDTQNFAILTRKKSLNKAKDDSATVLTNLFEEVETSSFKSMGVTPVWVDSHDEIPTLLQRVVDSQ